MIKMLIFSSVSVIALFAASAICLIVAGITFAETGTQQPEFGYFLLGGLASLVLGMRVRG